eukprot:126675_1
MYSRILVIISWIAIAFSRSKFNHPHLSKLFNDGVKHSKSNNDYPIPQISSSWTANVIDPPDGAGLEKYHFLDNIKNATGANWTNPSGHWFIYGDESRACTSLEWDVTQDPNGRGRYYLNCPEDCCFEYSGDDVKEWQIGAGKNGMENTQFIGNKSIESWGKTYDCMGWETEYHGAPGKLGKVTYKFWLTFPTNNLTDVANTILHRIDYNADAVPPGEIQYSNFTPIVGWDAQTKFGEQFVLPTACNNHPPSCDTDTDY